MHKKKIAFFDRDGVINKNAGDHLYITNPDSFIFNPGIFELLTVVQNQGFEIIILTNQRGVARGFLSLSDLKKIHDKMTSDLAKQGIQILDILICPHNENVCDCRKPKPGLLQMAIKRYEIEISKSVLFSDSANEIQMAENFGLLEGILVSKNRPDLIDANAKLGHTKKVD